MNLEFLKRLLELYNQYRPLAVELIPIIQKLIAGISAESGMTTEQVIADTRVKLDALDLQLIQDLEHP